MGRCKDCKHWEEVKGTFRCCWGPWDCPSFEGTPKGPFKVHEDQRGLFIAYEPKLQYLGYWANKEAAERVCEILNDEWAIAKGERRE